MVGGEIKVVMTLDNKDFSIKTVQAGKVINDLKRSMEQTAASTKAIEDRFNSFGQKFRDITFSISVLRFALQDVNDILLALPRAVVGASAEIERMTKLLEGLSTQSDEAARKLEAAANVKFVFDLAKNAPFEVTALTDAFVKFKSAGLDPTNGSLQALVDSVARFGGSSEQLKRASVAIQQMAGKGVISMEELRQQLGEAVPNAMQLMAEGMGISMSELVKRISKGEVEAKTALTQMTTMMIAVNGGAAEKMMGTWAGQMARLKTEVTLMFAEMGNSGGKTGLFETVKDQLKEINALLGSREARAFASDLGYSIASIAKGIAATVRFIYQFRDAIVFAGQAWLTFFALNKVNQFRQYMVDTFTKVKAAAADYINAAMQGERQKLAAEARARVERIAAEAAAARREIEILRRKHAEGLALENQYRANWERLDQRAQTLKTARARQRNAEMASHQFQLAMAQERANAKIAASIKTLEGVSVSAYGRMNAQTGALRRGLEGASLASVMLGRAMGGLRSIFAAMGGWIGLIVTALTAAAAAWLNFGNEAEDAVRRANDAIKAGAATMDDYLAKQKELQDQEKRALELRSKIATYEKIKRENKVSDPVADAAVVRMKEELRKIEADQLQTFRDMREAKVQAERNAQADLRNLAEQSLNKELADMQSAYNTRRTLKLKELGEGEAFNKWSVAQTKKLADEQYAHVQGNVARIAALLARAKGNPQLKIDVNKLEAERRVYEAKLLELQDFKNGAGSLGSIKTISMQSDKLGADGSMESTLSPIDQLLNDLAAKREDLKAEIAGYEGDVAKLAYVLNNTLQYTGKKSGAPSQAEKDRAIQEQVVIDKLKKDQQALEEYEAVIERIKSSQSDIDTVMGDALSALSAGDTAAPGHLTALNKTLADYKRALVELAEGGGVAARLAQEQLNNWEETSRQMVAKANIATLAKDAADFAEKGRQIEAGLLDNDRESKRKREVAELEHQARLFAIRLQASYGYRELTEQETKERAEIIEKFEKGFIASLNQIQRDARSPMQRLADDWRDIAKQLEDATTSWANQTIDMMMEFVKTGKLQFKELLESILTDILRIQMQKQMSSMLESIFGELAKKLGDIMGVKSGGSTGPTPAYDAAKNANRVTIVDGEASGSPTDQNNPEQQQKSFLDTLKEKLESMWKGVKDMFGQAWDFLSGIFSRLGDGLTSILGSLGSTLSSLMGSLTNALSSAFSSFGGSGGGLLDAAGDFFGGMDWASIGSDLLGFFGFANGGIMTSGGPLDLKAYAKGGVATSPQLALFGEGSMNEAFVPLPDGRSIPVTMRGGGGGAVVNVNVTEAPGTQAEVRESKGADGSTQIDVIIKQVEDKISQNLSKGRGSLASTMERTYGLNRAAGAYR